MSYRDEILRTLNPETTDTLTNSALGLCGEAGEFADLVKKQMFHGHELDIGKALKELGDIRYYLELAAFSIGATMEEVEQSNITKLRTRYPDGFSVERSINKLDV